MRRYRECPEDSCTRIRLDTVGAVLKSKDGGQEDMQEKSDVNDVHEDENDPKKNPKKKTKSGAK